MSILLKWFALVTMTIDHVGAVFGWSGLDLIPFAISQPMRIIGRAAFPLYAWGLAAGWRRTRSPGRYFGNLAACAVVSQLPFTLALYGANLHPSGAVPFYFAFRPGYVLLGLGLSAAVGWLARSRAAAFWTFLAAALAGLQLKAGGFWLWAGEDLNVLYTLALAAACLGLRDSWRGWEFAQRATAATALAAALAFLGLRADYGTGFVGLLLVLGLALLGRAQWPGPAQAVYVLAWGAVFYGCYQQNWPMLAGLLLPAALIAAQGGMACAGLPARRWTPGWKHFFYAWYPAHLLVLGVLSAWLRPAGQ